MGVLVQHNSGETIPRNHHTWTCHKH